MQRIVVSNSAAGKKRSELSSCWSFIGRLWNREENVKVHDKLTCMLASVFIHNVIRAEEAVRHHRQISWLAQKNFILHAGTKGNLWLSDEIFFWRHFHFLLLVKYFPIDICSLLKVLEISSIRQSCDLDDEKDVTCIFQHSDSRH